MTHRSSTAVFAAAALAGLLVAGCSKPADQASSTGSTTSTAAMASSAPAAAVSSDASSAGVPASGAAGSSSSQTVASTGDAAHGSSIYTANCTSCHGAAGAGGGIGPSLKGEKSRKDTAAAIAWIKNPKAPMPKLYPSPLSEKDVSDVAAYVESL